MNRRGLLLGAAATGAAAALGSFGRRAHAFGEVPSSVGDLMLPPEQQVTSVLELYLFGGVSQYESFFAIPSHGDDPQDPQGWHLHLKSGELEQTLTECNFGSDELLLEFGADALGQKVNLGPFAAPLWDRGDLLDRMRICVTSHPALPHEVAIPMSLAGRRLGDPKLAGLGAHIQRYYQERDGGGGTLPVSYVLLPSDELVIELGSSAYATGAHPATARPLPLVVDQMTQLTELLRRGKVGNLRDSHDALVAANLKRYQDRLRHGGELLRSGRLDDAIAAANGVKLAPSLQQILDPSLFAPVPGEVCGTQTPLDKATMSMKLAAHLLTSPSSNARYVCVLEAGMVKNLDAGGFDTHQNNCGNQARNVTNALRALTSVINAPGEKDPGKIDLDKTLVIINTDFGRTPHGEGTKGGRGHWPFGFPVIMMGGPIRRENGAVFGATDPSERATESLTPAHHRIGALLALGIWPFDEDSYNVSDVGLDVGLSEAGAVDILRKRLFAA